jgi:hypothetical protein
MGGWPPHPSGSILIARRWYVKDSPTGLLGLVKIDCAVGFGVDRPEAEPLIDEL